MLRKFRIQNVLNAFSGFYKLNRTVIVPGFRFRVPIVLMCKYVTYDVIKFVLRTSSFVLKIKPRTEPPTFHENGA